MGFTQEEVMGLESVNHLAHERDQEIQKIAQSIEELSAIFKELAVLVIDQGTVLDRIDYNMETVVETTRRGNMELETAEKYQKSNRASKCITILVVLILVFMVILAMKWS